MIVRAEQVHACHNIGLFDRISRFVIGVAMLAGGSYYVAQAGALHAYTATEAGMLVMMLVSIYPLMTAILGVDPLYSITGVKSGGDTGRNQCGTFPYQVKAALGKAPRYCETGDCEHSLESCHDDPRERPRHAYWRVDQEPMLYPDDATVAKFAARERRLRMAGK